MIRSCPTVWRAALLLSAVAAAGCPRAAGKGAGQPVPPAQTPPQVVTRQPDPPAPAPPPPAGADLDLQAAWEAELKGDFGLATAMYTRALSQPMEPSRRADAQFRSALLLAHPDNPQRDTVELKARLQELAYFSPNERRAREAKAVLGLLDDVLKAQAESATLKADIEQLKVRLAALETRLKEKEDELAGIKKVLLEGKGKP